jgi:hypothetical protein
MPAPIRTGTTANRVVRFMRDQHKRMLGAHKLLLFATTRHDYNDSADSVLVGLLIILASFKELLEIVSELDSRFTVIEEQYEPYLTKWHLFRHDAAHSADRLFRESPARITINDPKMPWGFRTIGYDRATDSVGTGETEMKLADELDVATDILNNCNAIIRVA